MIEGSENDNWLIALAADRIKATWTNAKERARKLRASHPTATPDDLANIVIDDAAFWSAVVGVGVRAVKTIPAMGQAVAVAAVAPEIVYIVKLEFDTALNVAALYEEDIPHEMLVPTLLSCLVYSMGHEFIKEIAIKAGQRLTRRAIEEVLQGATLATIKQIAMKLGIEVTKKGLLEAVPLIAIPISAVANYGGLQLFGRMAKHYFSHNWVMCGDCGYIQPRRNKFCGKCAVGMTAQ